MFIGEKNITKKTGALWPSIGTASLHNPHKSTGKL